MGKFFGKPKVDEKHASKKLSWEDKHNLRHLRLMAVTANNSLQVYINSISQKYGIPEGENWNIDFDTNVINYVGPTPQPQQAPTQVPIAAPEVATA